MAILDFFKNPAKNLAETTAQNVDLRMSRHLAEINARMNGHLAEINERLRRIESWQKETTLQIEEIDSNLHGDGDETVYISALISLADIIEDFYYFASADMDSSNQDSLNQDSSNQDSLNQSSALFEQAQMMWDAARNKIETAGLTIIDPASEPFDFNFHSIEGTAWDESLPAGYVIKTLKCGYIFNDEVMRQAAVIVNKEEIIVPGQ